MRTQLSYNVASLATIHLQESLKELEREIFRANKYEEDGIDQAKKIERLEHDRQDLTAAIDELLEYKSYLANYATA